MLNQLAAEHVKFSTMHKLTSYPKPDPKEYNVKLGSAPNRWLKCLCTLFLLLACLSTKNMQILHLIFLMFVFPLITEEAKLYAKSKNILKLTHVIESIYSGKLLPWKNMMVHFNSTNQGNNWNDLQWNSHIWYMFC